MTGENLALSPVELAALEASTFDAIYPPTERIPAIVMRNFPALGRLCAMRFLEWVQAHPGGVVSLATGKTPEYFIKWTAHLLEHWEQPHIRRLLEDSGVDPSSKPEVRSLHFVQMDEFYPINPRQHNSFCHYVSRFYLEGLGLDRSRSLLIDCTKIGLGERQTLESIWPDGEVELDLRFRSPTTRAEAEQKDVLARIDDWCMRREEEIRTLGGIGFFLGGIGPDGHIGFNVRGSDHFSTTRLARINYETQAAAAMDLGGIEVSRKRHVITIGLGTITANPDCVAIVMVAGEAKAPVVRDAVQSERHVLYPATALQGLRHARFYLTRGAAKGLDRRRLAGLATRERIADELVERVLVRRSVALRRRLLDLDRAAIAADPEGEVVLAGRSESPETLAQLVHDRLAAKIGRGAQTLSGCRFLHTEPHHDDLLLGYLPYIVRHVRRADNTHYFACMTSGFTAVTNLLMQEQLVRLRALLDDDEFLQLLEEGYFHPRNEVARNRDIWEYLDGVAADKEDQRIRGRSRRLLRDLIEVYGCANRTEVLARIDLLLDYFHRQFPGQRDEEHVQTLKGLCREWEAECLWGYFGWNCASVMHLRLGFYTGDIFTEEPTVERDVAPIQRALETARPDVVSVALDPEASGPDTHYKVLQAFTEALKRYERQSGRSDIKVWGYRNVWYRFDPAEADILVPVSLNMFATLHSAFMNAFVSQKTASFPSYEWDGPFCELAQRIQVEQYQAIKLCLGRQWFNEHEVPLIRATRGLVFLKEMTLEELYAHSRELRQNLEDR